MKKKRQSPRLVRLKTLENTTEFAELPRFKGKGRKREKNMGKIGKKKRKKGEEPDPAGNHS